MAAAPESSSSSASTAATRVFPSAIDRGLGEMMTLQASAAREVKMNDDEAIRAVALDYIEGWFDGDAGRMERALHPELVKRCRGIEGEDPDALETLTAREMIDATAEGVGRGEDAEDRQIALEISHLSGEIAGVTCLCHRYVDLLHLIRMPEGWRIVNAVWRLR
jgi:hypothetical protein